MITDLESRLHNDVSIDAPWALLETFSTIIREHPDECNRAADIIAERLAAFGVPVTMHEPTLLLSMPGESHVTVDGRKFRAKTPAMSQAAPGGIEAELLYVRSRPSSLFLYSRKPEDLFGEAFEAAGGVGRIAGRILVTEGYSNPAKISLFEEWGAAAVIIVNPGKNIHWGSCSTIWGAPDLDSLPRKPKITVAIVNNPDGQAIIERAKAGKSAAVVTNLDEGWFKSKLPVAEIPGQREPEKFVLLHGHYDGWHYGVGDNGTGNAAKLEIARVLWNHRDKLRRSVRIAWWPGHSSGRYAGSSWYADTFAMDLDENCVAHSNCDSPGCRWATAYRDIPMMPETIPFATDAIRDLTGQEATTKRPNRSSDYTFNNIGISGFFMASSMLPEEVVKEKNYYYCGGCGGNIEWHTEDDTMEVADKDVLLTDIKLYLLAVARVARAEVLPFDWRPVAREIGETVASYQKAAGTRFDFSPLAEDVERLGRRLDDFYSALDAGKVAAPVANGVIQGLARVLIPADFTYQPRFTHDPAMVVPRLAAIAKAAELDDFDEFTLGVAQTHLKRGQNRLRAAIRQAVRQVDAALA